MGGDREEKSSGSEGTSEERDPPAYDPEGDIYAGLDYDLSAEPQEVPLKGMPSLQDQISQKK